MWLVIKRNMWFLETSYTTCIYLQIVKLSQRLISYNIQYIRAHQRSIKDHYIVSIVYVHDLTTFSAMANLGCNCYVTRTLDFQMISFKGNLVFLWKFHRILMKVVLSEMKFMLISITFCHTSSRFIRILIIAFFVEPNIGVLYRL